MLNRRHTRYDHEHADRLQDAVWDGMDKQKRDQKLRRERKRTRTWNGMDLQEAWGATRDRRERKRRIISLPGEDLPLTENLEKKRLKAIVRGIKRGLKGMDFPPTKRQRVE